MTGISYLDNVPFYWKQHSAKGWTTGEPAQNAIGAIRWEVGSLPLLDGRVHDALPWALRKSIRAVRGAA